MNIRSVAKSWKSKPTMEGAGVHLKRAFGFHETGQLDPFLLLDAFKSENPSDYQKGFPWHPHRGIETITYILDGNVEHQDSMGNGGVISAGDVQWMTAGGGILHQEMPKGDRKGQMWGFQLWANLPAKNKMMNSRYQEIKDKTIPHVKTPEGALIRVICGEAAGAKGPVQGLSIDPEFLDVSLPADKTFTHPVKPGRTAFAYVIEGEVYFDQERTNSFSEDTMVLFSEGDIVTAASVKKPARFLLISGNPIKEPIAWYGPVVMNTQGELKLAFQELEKGTFIKSAGKSSGY